MTDSPDTTPRDDRTPGSDDWSPARLDELAPQVDLAAARAALDHERRRARARRTSVLVGVAVVVAVGLVGAVGLGRDRTEDLATRPPEDLTSSTTTDAPAVTGPETTGPDVGTPGATSPFVGRTELELRETYPLVRTLFRDGQAVGGGFDLRPGRISISVEGGVVTAAGVECPDDVTLEPWAAQACDPGPDDGPTVWGKLIPAGGGLALEPGFNARRYYEGLLVDPTSAPPGTPVHDMAGVTVPVAELRAEDVVHLWISGGCRESRPVQCTIDAIVVERS